MTLTVCIGASGSGKTTFLNDVYNRHKCVYIRQYHNLRPYITVSQIPGFDPSQLPYWDIYVREGKDKTIQVGGTMAGKFYAGISGGQRKMLLFELIYQRTKDQEDLLIVLDEPFAGVTDDFVPYIVDRLNLMRMQHNILLVTNDHVQTLTAMSDNTITVSAIDRTTVKINSREKVDRNQALLAMSIGDAYVPSMKSSDLFFFYNVEIRKNGDIMGVLIFAIICFILFIATFWNSTPGYSEPLVMIAGGIIAYFSVNPYLIGLVDWRNLVVEETEALLHSSASKMKTLKTMLTIFLVLIIALIEYGVINLVIDTLRKGKYFVAMLFDSASLTFPLICTSLYTTLPFQPAQILGSMPFLLMIFFSTTFSPSSGVPFFNSFRYLFARFYFWCMIPGVSQQMEGCPTGNITILYLILAGLLNVFLFLCIKGIFQLVDYRKSRKNKEAMKKSMMAEGFGELQVELFGTKALKKLKHLQTMTSPQSSTSIAALESNTKGDAAIEKDMIDEEKNIVVSN